MATNQSDGAPAFGLATGSPREMGPPIRTTFVPRESASVVEGPPGRRRVCLTKKLGEGGEGAVFATDSGLVCKTYHPSRLTAGLREKLELMIARPVEHPAICWPRSLALDERGGLVGYLMPAARGQQLHRAIFVKQLLRQTFPSGTRVELATLAASVLQALVVLHERNVLVGDINPLNVLVASEREIFLVDCDSYQIEDFACPVGTATFLAPDLLGKNLSHVLRTFAHEHFAVATLLFMILVPGKPPYSHAGGGDPAENVRRRHFPYPLKEKHGAGVPVGPWRFIWSHLPFRLKEAFHAVFADGAVVATHEWLDLVRQYQHALEQGYVSRELFPSRLKPLSRTATERGGGRWLVCRACGIEFGTFHERGDVCGTCGRSETEERCFLCHRAFMMRAAQRSRLGDRAPLCELCLRTTTPASCRDCGQLFEITGPERAYCQQRGFILPVRCKPCRQRRRGSPTGAFGAPKLLARPDAGSFLAGLRRALGER